MTIDPLLIGFHTRGVHPTRVGVYARISDDPRGLEAGVGRQVEDAATKAVQLGWPVPLVPYVENDVSAFRKRRVTLPDGTVGYRVIRPIYRRAVTDLEAGVIDGLLVYDLDRLARETRDLEDLIDVVKATRRPVRGVTSEIDLMTADGQFMARTIVNVAQKSSQDTGRRVARAAAEKARSGRQAANGRRVFGWADDRVTLHPTEAPALRTAVEAIALGAGLGTAFDELLQTGLPTVAGGPWRKTTFRQMIRSPRAAGIRGYKGKGRETAPSRDDWRAVAVRDLAGEYVMGDWTPLVDVAMWEAANLALDANRTGQTWRRRHLLTGILRCGLCGGKMHVRSHHGGPRYVCPGKANGTCGKIARRVDVVEPYVLELIGRYLADVDALPATAAVETDDIGALRERIVNLRAGYAAGKVSDDTLFTVLPPLEEQLAQATETARKATRPTVAPAKLREVWFDSGGAVERRRAVLAQVVTAIKVMPADRPNRRSPWDPERELVILWA